MIRPKTRGELRDLLQNGTECEVVTSNVETTSLMLKGWLEYDGFTVRPSENEGWSVFVPRELEPCPCCVVTSYVDTWTHSEKDCMDLCPDCLETLTDLRSKVVA